MMSVKKWDAAVGLFSSASHHSPGKAPATGSKLVIQASTAIRFNQTFGSCNGGSVIALTGATVDDAPG